MQHDLVHSLWCVDRVSFAPIIADRVGEYCPASIKRRTRYRASNLWIPLQSMLSIFVPEVERAVRTCSAEGAVDRVKLIELTE